MSKFLWDHIFRRLQPEHFGVRYWDGQEVCYGASPSLCQLTFNKEPRTAGFLANPALTLGEAYMDGEVDLDGDFDELIRLANRLSPGRAASWLGWLAGLAGRILNLAGAKRRQRANIAAHYDLGNDFFALWLDDTLSYSCAYFKNPADTLKEAQLQKIELILKKLRLQPGMRLLEIGCGWGHLALKAAGEYGARVVGITLSREQCEKGQARLQEAGLGGQAEIRLQNYLDLPAGQFDRVVSVGMFEHVGRAYLGRYLEKVRELLVPGGVSLLHTLTSAREGEVNPWIRKYIFPGGYIPSLREVIDLLPAYDLRLLHLESLRPHYARTLEIWHQNFMARGDEVLRMFDRRFQRMWSLYLRASAAALRLGHLDVHQLVFSKGVNNRLPLTWAGLYD